MQETCVSRSHYGEGQTVWRTNALYGGLCGPEKGRCFRIFLQRRAHLPHPVRTGGVWSVVRRGPRQAGVLWPLAVRRSLLVEGGDAGRAHAGRAP